MTTQKALILPKKFGEWTLGEIPVQKPGPKELLVKVSATALNPVDWKIKEYGFFVSEYPWVGGTDGAGIVEQVGSEVTNVAKGDKMYVPGVSRTVSSQGGVLITAILHHVPPASSKAGSRTTRRPSIAAHSAVTHPRQDPRTSERPVNYT